jgi:hypothetical protein
MNGRKKNILFFVLETSVGGSVYVPPTLCLRPAYSAARAAAYVACTGSARTNAFAGRWSANSMAPNSLILEVG